MGPSLHIHLAERDGAGQASDVFFCAFRLNRQRIPTSQLRGNVPLQRGDGVACLEDPRQKSFSFNAMQAKR